MIVIDDAVDKEAQKVFKDARGREPNADELYALRRVWLDNEVLYREGLALQMDKGDKAITDRVIFKAVSMVNAGLKRPPVDDTVLRTGSSSNRVKYDEPARYDFQEAVLDGDASEAGATAFAAALNAGTPGDAKAGLRVFKARPHPNIVQSYGAEFAQALEALPVGEWRALRHGDGWRVMRLEAVDAGQAGRVRGAARRGAAGLDRRGDGRAAHAPPCACWRKKYTVKVEASERHEGCCVRACSLLAVLALLATPASAHEISMAEMELRQASPAEFVWQWTAGNRRR